MIDEGTAQAVLSLPDQREEHHVWIAPWDSGEKKWTWAVFCLTCGHPVAAFNSKAKAERYVDSYRMWTDFGELLGGKPAKNQPPIWMPRWVLVDKPEEAAA